MKEGEIFSTCQDTRWHCIVPSRERSRAQLDARAATEASRATMMRHLTTRAKAFSPRRQTHRQHRRGRRAHERDSRARARVHRSRPCLASCCQGEPLTSAHVVAHAHAAVRHQLTVNAAQRLGPLGARRCRLLPINDLVHSEHASLPRRSVPPIPCGTAPSLIHSCLFACLFIVPSSRDCAVGWVAPTTRRGDGYPAHQNHVALVRKTGRTLTSFCGTVYFSSEPALHNNTQIKAS